MASKVTTSLQFRQIALVVSIVAGLCAAVILAEKSNEVSAEELYAIVVGMSHKNGPARAKAAKMLSIHPDAEPWLVLLFVSSQTAKVGDKEEQARQRARHVFDLGKVAVVLRHLPQDVSPSVLWALTYLLNERGRGKWSEEIGIILRIRKQCISPPIRQLVRKCLKDRLGIDHEWDASAWRAAIMKRKTNESAKVDAKPKVETQPAKART